MICALNWNRKFKLKRCSSSLKNINIKETTNYYDTLFLIDLMKLKNYSLNRCLRHSQTICSLSKLSISCVTLAGCHFCQGLMYTNFNYTYIVSIIFHQRALLFYCAIHKTYKVGVYWKYFKHTGFLFIYDL